MSMLGWGYAQNTPILFREEYRCRLLYYVTLNPGDKLFQFTSWKRCDEGHLWLIFLLPYNTVELANDQALIFSFLFHVVCKQHFYITLLCTSFPTIYCLMFSWIVLWKYIFYNYYAELKITNYNELLLLCLTCHLHFLRLSKVCNVFLSSPFQCKQIIVIIHILVCKIWNHISFTNWITFPFSIQVFNINIIIIQLKTVGKGYMVSSCHTS